MLKNYMMSTRRRKTERPIKWIKTYSLFIKRFRVLLTFNHRVKIMIILYRERERERKKHRNINITLLMSIYFYVHSFILSRSFVSVASSCALSPFKNKSLCFWIKVGESSSVIIQNSASSVDWKDLHPIRYSLWW